MVPYVQQTCTQTMPLQPLSALQTTRPMRQQPRDDARLLSGLADLTLASSHGDMFRLVDSCVCGDVAPCHSLSVRCTR